MEFNENLKNLMNSLGVDEDGARIYRHLLKKGPRTALTISRETEFSRTQVYKILEELTQEGIVNEVLQEHGRIFEAASPEYLGVILEHKYQKVQSLEESLPEIIESLSLVTREDISKSKIKYYQGVSGLKQVVWNETRAEGIFRIYEIEKIQSFLDEKFAAEILVEFVKNEIVDRQLTNIKQYNEYTEVEEFVKNWWEIRYVSPEDLKINFETKIYNDVFCIYDFVDDDVFCVEIYNENLAEMQKQIFDFVWENATPMKIIDTKGKAVVEDESSL